MSLKKKTISLSKPLLCQELKQRNSGKKLNINNKKMEDLFMMLREQEELDEVDKIYIQREISQYIEQLKKGIKKVEN